MTSPGCAHQLDHRPPPVAELDGWERIIVGDQLKAEVSTIAGIEWLATGDGTWSAFGTYQERPGGLVKPAAWASGHATRWQKVGVPVPADEGGEVRAAASGGGTAFLAGAVGTGTGAIPALWRSTDGWRWSQPVRLPLPPGRSSGMVAVAMTPAPGSAGGWLVAGETAPGVGADPVVWYSPDAESWSLVDLGSQNPVLSSGRYTVAGLASQPGVAVLALNPVGPSSPAVLARTVDGSVWSTGTLAGAVSVESLVAAGPEFVAAVDCCPDHDRPASLMASTDALSWVPVPGPEETETSDRRGRVVRLAVDRHVDPEQLYAVTVGSDKRSEFGLYRRGVDRGFDGGARWTELDRPGWFAAGRSPGELGPPPVIAVSGGGLVWSEPSERSQDIWVAGQVGDGAWERADTELIPPPARMGADHVLAAAASPSGDTAVVVGYHGPFTPEPPTLPEADVETGGRLWVANDPRRWEEVALSRAIISVNDVLAIPGGFFAAGVRRSDDGVLRPAWLRSADGRHWDRLDLQLAEDSLREPLFLPARVVRPGSVFVAGGVEVDVASGVRPAIRTSTDGVAWEPATVPDPPGVGMVTGLCSTGDRVVAVGTTRAERGEGPARAFIWSSVDGRSWEDLRLGSVVESVRGCAIGSDGALVVVGWIQAADGRALPALWRRSAGDAAWVEQVLPLTGPITEMGEAQAFAVHHDGSGWLAVGSGRDHIGTWYPVVWASRDGANWELRTEVVATVTGGSHGAAFLATRWRDRMLVAGTYGDAGLVLSGPPPA
ncbi:MAG: hypothetical protein N2037_09110 [Acidimicrobiales bacterium]|nr:hypothetical protein [Acidimicrobiales bacterium]